MPTSSEPQVTFRNFLSSLPGDIRVESTLDGTDGVDWSYDFPEDITAMWRIESLLLHETAYVVSLPALPNDLPLLRYGVGLASYLRKVERGEVAEETTIWTVRDCGGGEGGGLTCGSIFLVDQAWLGSSASILIASEVVLNEQ
ncbi:hypothetical protein Y032_0058g2856 [Ancylostoma ceylanicum]|uniref:Uncharacterized protein n=1 Tax=Ancylostoma ceylanicum TaxID=53326 RepID=A0A016U4T1_9BILA|nr:hypothetical protein Y032_0058g2856 [Ancylostoma ceylanicum]